MERTLTPTRKADRLTDDRDVLNALLDEVMVAHVGLSLPEGPLVLPVGFARDGDRILLHGSTGSRRMRTMAAGAPVCVTVSSLDAIKVSRAAFGTGMRYRSACIFGSCEVLQGEDKRAALEVFTDRFLPGRTTEVRPPSAKELAATMVFALPLRTWSVKVAGGFCDDEPEDLASDAWAGVVPVGTRFGEPVDNPDLRAGISVPASVTGLVTPA